MCRLQKPGHTICGVADRKVPKPKKNRSNYDSCLSGVQLKIDIIGMSNYRPERHYERTTTTAHAQAEKMPSDMLLPWHVALRAAGLVMLLLIPVAAAMTLALQLAPLLTCLTAAAIEAAFFLWWWLVHRPSLSAPPVVHAPMPHDPQKVCECVRTARPAVSKSHASHVSIASAPEMNALHRPLDGCWASLGPSEH